MNKKIDKFKEINMGNELKIEIKIIDFNDNIKKFIKDYLNQLIYKEPFLPGCYQHDVKLGCRHTANLGGKCYYSGCPLRLEEIK